MKNHNVRYSVILDYAIGVLSMVILVLGTFLMPQLYSTIVDNKDLNKTHVVERENFSFQNPIEMTVYEQVQLMMEAIAEKNPLKRTLYLSGSDMKDDQLLESVREAMDILTQYKLIPDLSAYDIEKNVVYAEYYNLSDSTKEGTEKAFWVLRCSDMLTFDFTFRVDASEYIIYQAELYCAETADYAMQLTSDDTEVVKFLNEQFITGAASYYEPEGFEALTALEVADMALMMGYERGEYAVFRSTCSKSYIEGMGIRWGFVPMTVALENGSVTEDWGYRSIVDYFKDEYGVNIFETGDKKK